MTQPMSDLLTVPEAAALLRLKPSTLRAWVLRRKIAFCKIGRLVRIPREAVEKFVLNSTIPPTGAISDASIRQSHHPAA